MGHTAISISYDMEQAPKERTPIDAHRNSKTAVCHKCGPVQVLTVKTRFLGAIPDKDKPREDWEGRSIDLCGECQSVIQTPIEQPKPKKRKPDWALTTTEELVYGMLLDNLNCIVTYAEFQAVGISMTSDRAGIANYIAAIRRKMPQLVIKCQTGTGYVLVGTEDEEEGEE